MHRAGRPVSLSATVSMDDCVVIRSVNNLRLVIGTVFTKFNFKYHLSVKLLMGQYMNYNRVISSIVPIIMLRQPTNVILNDRTHCIDLFI